MGLAAEWITITAGTTIGAAIMTAGGAIAIITTITIAITATAITTTTTTESLPGGGRESAMLFLAERQ